MLKFVKLLTVFNIQLNDTRRGIDYYICITSISIICHHKCTITNLYKIFVVRCLYILKNHTIHIKNTTVFVYSIMSFQSL